MTTYSHFFWNFVLARRRPWRWEFAIGAVLPDVVYFPLMLRTIAEHGAGSWGDLALWDAAAAHPVTIVLHSYVPVGCALAITYAAGWVQVAPWLWGMFTHVVIDMLTHVRDAYPILWPLADYRFPSPVSYYESAHYGREFFFVEHGAMAVVLLLLAVGYVRRRWAGRAPEPVKAADA